jgi:hypothetical protein
MATTANRANYQTWGDGLKQTWNDTNQGEIAMSIKIVAIAAALALSVGSAAFAGEENTATPGGFRELGPGGAVTQGINPAYHSAAATKCARQYKSYDPSTMTFVGKDGQRHPCPG